MRPAQKQIDAIAFPAVLAAVIGLASGLQADPPPKFSAEQLEFFEQQVKPILKANCLACHGGETKIESGLNLTTREGLLQGGESGPAVSLDEPESSLLLEAINYRSLEMPPKGKLPQAQVEVLTRWVKMGLPWPDKERASLVHRGATLVDEAARNWWSFRPLTRPPVPAVEDQAWVRNPIDAFILAKLEERGLRPAPPAEPEALLRRLYYAITGLPPSPEEVEQFVRSVSPSLPRDLSRTCEGEGEKGTQGEWDRAYEAVVDKLLASRRFGEHWGRHWLDLVRYAETNSFERDNPKPFVWRYRDYVIRSFNEDKPYDQFIREQLAGDELDEVTPQTIIATGYYRLGLWDDEPADPVMAYYDGLDDIVTTTGQTFLGLTVNCARCHDHKIDPFPQRDYYRLLAFFHGIKHYGQRSDESVAAASLVSIATPEEAERFREVAAAYERQVAQLNERLLAMEEPLQAKLSGGERDDFKYPRNRISILRKHVGELLTQEQFDDYVKMRREAERLARERPKAAELALAVKEDPQPRDTFVFLRGNPLSQGERVEPGFPAVLVSAKASPSPSGPASQAGPARRRVLAEWIASEENPLTSRVIVNRLWQYTFGRGIVRSSSDFGYQGTPPTHPELLDWLASELVSGDGWRLKPLVRLMVTSNAFRMSGRIDPAAAKIDPENDLLSHFDLRRLTAEEIRDSILAVCGNLNLEKQEGPSVYPPIPAEVHAGQSKPGYGWPTSGPKDAAARSVFVHIKRSLALPILAAFDAADPDAPCPVRFTTTQPTQALGMLNSEFVNMQARVLAENTMARAASDPAAQVKYVLWRVLQRCPTSDEVNRGVSFLEATREAEKVSAEEALRQFCLLALNLNEFVYLE